jgi:hypothetical protein
MAPDSVKERQRQAVAAEVFVNALYLGVQPDVDGG